MTDRPALVIFDCDGVLVDTERLTVGIEARVLTDLGWEMTADEVVRRWMGRTSQTQLGDISERLGVKAAEAFETRTSSELRDVFDRELCPVDGVTELVGRLHASGLATCVASSGTHDRMRLTLGMTGLLPEFEGRIFSASEVEHGKPAPDLFLHAADALGADPGSCVVIEDSVYGVRAGVAAGMTVYGFAGGLTSAQDLAEAGAVTFERMADVGSMIGL